MSKTVSVEKKCFSPKIRISMFHQKKNVNLRLYILYILSFKLAVENNKIAIKCTSVYAV